MGTHRIQCSNPDCARVVRVPPEALGRRVRCPICKQEIRVPGNLAELRKLDDKAHFRLQIVKGPAYAGTEHTLDSDRTYTAGRGDNCELQLPGATVGKRHFSLHWVNNQWVLEDLNSPGGTEVDGLAITKLALRGGETIEVGAYTLKFHKPGDGLGTPSTGGQLVVPANESAPLPLSQQNQSAASTASDEEQRLREAQSFTAFSSEHLDDEARAGARSFSLSLATRLIAVAGLLVLVTVLSIIGKSWLDGGKSGGSAFDGGDEYAASYSEDTQTVPVFPEPFTRALEANDFELAARLIDQTRQENTNSEFITAMQDRLRNDGAQFRARLWSECQQAISVDEWDKVVAKLRAADNPALGELTYEWTDFKYALQQHDYLVKADELRRQERWLEALEQVRLAEQLPCDNRHVPLTREFITEAMGSGLQVNVTPTAARATVTLNGREINATGTTCWKLEPGRAKLRVSADGYFDFVDQVDLYTGNLTTVDVALARQAPPWVWSLLALEHAAAHGPLWLAAEHYADQHAISPAIAAVYVERGRSAMTLDGEPVPLKLIVIRTTNGEEFTAQVTNEAMGMLSVERYPTGERYVLRASEIASRQDLDAAAMVATVLGDIEAQRRKGLTALGTLQRLAKLRIDLAADEQAVRAACAPLVQTCVAHTELACAVCAGACTCPCPRCGGQGFKIGMTDCAACNGAGSTECTNCRGNGTVKCPRCYGSGRIQEQVPEDGKTRLRARECPECTGTGRVSCRACRGSGRILCKKCKGSGQVEGNIDCPDCEDGRVPCQACNGVGTKEAMQPEARRQAEQEAARRTENQPAP